MVGWVARWMDGDIEIKAHSSLVGIEVKFILSVVICFGTER